MTSPLATKAPLEDSQPKFHRRILDGKGNVVGQTAVCKPVSDDEDSESGECEFLLLATNEPPENEKHKIAMQIRRRGRIAYRVNIADIRADAWDAANVAWWPWDRDGAWSEIDLWLAKRRWLAWGMSPRCLTGG